MEQIIELLTKEGFTLNETSFGKLYTKTISNDYGIVRFSWSLIDTKCIFSINISIPLANINENKIIQSDDSIDNIKEILKSLDNIVGIFDKWTNDINSMLNEVIIKTVKKED